MCVYLFPFHFKSVYFNYSQLKKGTVNHILLSKNYLLLTFLQFICKMYKDCNTDVMMMYIILMLLNKNWKQRNVLLYTIFYI